MYQLANDRPTNNNFAYVSCCVSVTHHAVLVPQAP